MRGLLLGLGLLASSAGAAAQTPVRTPDYLRGAVDLATYIGRAHAVRIRCNGREDQYWRGFMQELLSLEAPDQGSLRRSMVGAFNDAYSQEMRVRGNCDAEARRAEGAYAAEGRRIAESLAAFYLPKADKET